MKKILSVIAISIVLFIGILGYDIVCCDGEVLLNPLLGIESQYDILSPDRSNNTSKAKKITVTTPDIDKDLGMKSSVVELSPDETVFEDEIDGVETYDETSSKYSDDSRGYEFYFSLLSEEEKKIYRAMYDALADFESGNCIPTSDEDTMNKVAMAIRDDHPEFFYLGEMGYVHYTVGGQVQRTLLDIKYKDTKAMITSQKNMIDVKAQSIIDMIPADADDYTKVKIVYEEIINRTEYNTNAPDNQTIASALIYNQSVCAGYSRAMQYILNRVGIPTTFVEGNSLINGEDHAWNLCKLDDGYYFVDVTWGDASYSGNSGDMNVGRMNYDYLLVTSEDILKTHSINEFVPIPVCTATSNNYYIREGLFITEYDYGRMKEIFDEGYSLGQETVSFKCASDDVFEEMKKQLIRNNVIFDMLGDSTQTVSYVEDSAERTLCFWL